jgi:uncharacterized membrane protein
MRTEGAKVGGRDRAVALDLVRTAALLGMAVFHFVFDLVLFGHLPVAVIYEGFWPLWARVVASSFLFLSGLTLWLAHRNGLDRGRWARRLAKIAAAAALVTGATYLALGQGFVFWGILHMIAFGAVAGLAFLRLPAAVTAACAVLVFWTGWTVALPAFDAGPWLWTGLGAAPVVAVDYVPVFPWFSAVLAGIAAGRVATATGLWDRIAAVRVQKGHWADRLAWPGRHSLMVYLVHQPVLLAIVSAATQVLR